MLVRVSFPAAVNESCPNGACRILGWVEGRACVCGLRQLAGLAWGHRTTVSAMLGLYLQTKPYFGGHSVFEADFPDFSSCTSPPAELDTSS